MNARYTAFSIRCWKMCLNKKVRKSIKPTQYKSTIWQGLNTTSLTVAATTQPMTKSTNSALWKWRSPSTKKNNGRRKNKRKGLKGAKNKYKVFWRWMLKNQSLWKGLIRTKLALWVPRKKLNSGCLQLERLKLKNLKSSVRNICWRQLRGRFWIPWMKSPKIIFGPPLKISKRQMKSWKHKKCQKNWKIKNNKK